MKFFNKNYKDIISVENLLDAWLEFVKGKKSKKDIQLFSINLMDNIFKLQADLLDYTYKHGHYQEFNISDPKPRNIHKAAVPDRLLHHAIYRVLYPFYDRVFIADSFSCRIGRGIHKAIKRFETFARAISKNNTRTCWVLKCDIKKFFDSVDHQILMNILEKRIKCPNISWLLKEIIGSFNRTPIQLALFERERNGALRARHTNWQFNKPAFCQYLSQ